MTALCPDCGAGLDNDGYIDYWCPACQQVVPFTHAVIDTAGARDD